MTNKPYTSTYQAIRIDKSTNFGIIISGLEVVQAGADIEDIAAVAQGVRACQGSGLIRGVSRVVAFAKALIQIADQQITVAVD